MRDVAASASLDIGITEQETVGIQLDTVIFAGIAGIAGQGRAAGDSARVA